MGIFFGGSSSNTKTITVTNRDGSVAGTIKISNAAKKKTKRVQYNPKSISSQILRSKKSGSAGKAAIRARSTIASLRKKLGTGEYDDRELESAIIHAERMLRVAKKRMKHLEQEENAQKKAGVEESDWERDGKADPEYIFSEENAKLEPEDIQEILREMQEWYAEMAKSTGPGELSKELLEAEYNDLSPEDIELLKKKHRGQELRDIIDADMKYLKAVFDRLAKERQDAVSGVNRLGDISGVSLELGGLEMPVAAPQVPAMTGGASVDQIL